MAFDNSKPAQGNPVLTDVAQILANFLALRNCEASAAEPSNLVAGMFWLYTENTPYILRMRNEDNDGWLDVMNMNADGMPKAHIAIDTASASVHGARQGTGNGFDADTVDGYHAAAIATANNLIRADASGYFPANTVAKTSLKTGTNNSSISGSFSGPGSVACSMQDYCFFPRIYTSNQNVMYITGYSSSSASYVGRFGIGNSSGSTLSYDVDYRYMTASNNPFLYALVNKITGLVGHLWMSGDPPPGCWGLTSKPKNFEPPVLPDNFEDYDEICIFNYSGEAINELVAHSHKDKKLPFEMLNHSYLFNKNNRMFMRKNLSQI